jgi:hypothetical protein
MARPNGASSPNTISRLAIFSGRLHEGRYFLLITSTQILDNDSIEKLPILLWTGSGRRDCGYRGDPIAMLSVWVAVNEPDANGPRAAGPLKCKRVQFGATLPVSATTN